MRIQCQCQDPMQLGLDLVRRIPHNPLVAHPKGLLQALDDRALKALGRLHGADEAKAAVRLAQSLFPRVSFDLIYALHEQSREAWATELNQALGCGTEHL